MTQRTRLFYNYFKNWGSSEYDSNIFLQKLTLRTEPFFFQCDWKKLNSFFCIWLKELKFFWKTMTHGIEPFLLIWLTEWNPSFQFDSKNWTLFKILLKELNPFQHMTRRIEPFFKILLKELNPFQHMFFSYYSNTWVLF